MAPPELAGRPSPGLPWNQPQAFHGDPEETGRSCGSPGGPGPGSLPHPHRGHPLDLSLDSQTGRPAAGEQHTPAPGTETHLPGEEAERLALRSLAAPTPCHQGHSLSPQRACPQRPRATAAPTAAARAPAPRTDPPGAKALWAGAQPRGRDVPRGHLAPRAGPS